MRLIALASALLPLFAVESAAQFTCADENALAPSGGSGLAFGRAVAVDGDRAVVAADLEAYAYAWDGSAWVFEDLLTIPGAESGFGSSVALDDDTAVIGLPLQDGVLADEGRALVFVRSIGGTWSLEQELFASDADAGDAFGTSVALEGNRVVIGAPGDDTINAGAGSAYVFERAGTTWTETAKIEPGSPVSGLGTQVALSGSSAVLGGAQLVGGVFVHVEVGGIWSEQAELASSLLLAGGVDVEGDRAIAGGVIETIVYERVGTSWTETQRLSETGVTVALDGDRMALGGPSCPTIDPVRVLDYDGLVWSRSFAIDVTGGVLPLDLSGTRVLVGARDSFACFGGTAASYDLGNGLQANVDFRNGGSNPVSFTASPASIGETLQFTIDLSTTGHSFGLVIGFDSPFNLVLAGGQTLLCLDLLGGGEIINTGFFPGPTVNINLVVPNDPAFVGFEVYTQALHAFAVTPFALSNAQDIRIGGPCD